MFTCFSHKIKDLCDKCLQKDHSRCDISLTEIVERYRESCRKILDEQKLNTLKEFDERWREILNSLENKRQSLERTIENSFEKKRKSIDDLLEENPKYFDMESVNQFRPREFQIYFEETKLEHGVYVTSTQSSLATFDKNNFANKLILDCLDHNFMEKAQFQEDYCKRDSIFVQFFESEQFDKGFVFFNLNENDITNLQRALSKFPFVRTIIYSNISFNAHWEFFLSRGLSRSEMHLQSIIFFKCEINLEVTILQSALCHSKLEYFSLNQVNCVKPKSVGEIFKCIENSKSSLTTLNFIKCNLTRTDCEIIGNILDKFHSIKNFDINENQNMKDGFRFVYNRLKRSANCLEKINFSNCNLTDSHQIISLLDSCTSLNQINLKGNQQIKLSVHNYYLKKHTSFRIIL